MGMSRLAAFIINVMVLYIIRYGENDLTISEFVLSEFLLLSGVTFFFSSSFLIVTTTAATTTTKQTNKQTHKPTENKSKNPLLVRICFLFLQ